MGKRIGKDVPLSEVLKPDEGTVLRMTRRSLSSWVELCTSNLLKDVSEGRLNPNKIFLLRHEAGLVRRYGFAVDDLIYINAPVEIIENWNPRWSKPVCRIHGPAKKAVAIRLNPDRFRELSSLYRQNRREVIV